MNPDEEVAGAAVRRVPFDDEIKGVVLLDVTPLSMGIETMGGVTTKLIDANTTIPCKKSEHSLLLPTTRRRLPSMYCRVSVRWLHRTSQSASLPTGIAPARREIPQIEVTFDIDANGS